MLICFLFVNSFLIYFICLRIKFRIIKQIYSLHNSAIAGSKPGMKKEEDEGIEFALIHLTMMLL
jgi:hypothetical protein